MNKPHEIAENAITAHLNLAVRSLERKRGCAVYDRTDLDAFISDSMAYFKYLSMHNSGIDDHKAWLIPSVESWATWLGVGRMTIFNYAKRGADWASFIDRFKTAILSVKFQLAGSGQYSPVLLFFECGNSHSSYHNVNRPTDDPAQITDQRRSKADIMKQIGLVPDQDPEEEGET